MTLLRDIQDTAINPSTDVATLLRKCKVLAARLGNEEFNKWVDHELNGYNEIAELPEYRILNVQSYGHFSGPFGSGLKNAPIPPSCLPNEFRDRVTIMYMTQPISAYLSAINNPARENPRVMWPADMVALFGGEIYQNMNCLSAWQSIPYGALASLVDTIKTRVLNFVLEIEKEAPDAGEAPVNQQPLAQEKVSQVFNTYIAGNVQNVATGSSNFSQTAEIKVSHGNLESLEKYLDSLGVSKNEVNDLKVAISKDPAPFGEHVQSWLTKMLGKAASGTLKVGVSVASSLIGNALAKYFGLN